MQQPHNIQFADAIPPFPPHGRGRTAQGELRTAHQSRIFGDRGRPLQPVRTRQPLRNSGRGYACGASARHRGLPLPLPLRVGQFGPRPYAPTYRGTLRRVAAAPQVAQSRRRSPDDAPRLRPRPAGRHHTRPARPLPQPADNPRAGARPSHGRRDRCFRRLWTLWRTRVSVPPSSTSASRATCPTVSRCPTSLRCAVP